MDEQHVIQQGQVLLPVAVHLGIVRIDYHQQVFFQGMPVSILIFLSILVTVVVFPFQYVLYDGVALLQTFPIQARQVVLDVFLGDHRGDLDVQLLFELLMLSHQGWVVSLGYGM